MLTRVRKAAVKPAQYLVDTIDVSIKHFRDPVNRYFREHRWTYVLAVLNLALYYQRGEIRHTFFEYRTHSFLTQKNNCGLSI